MTTGRINQVAREIFAKTHSASRQHNAATHTNALHVNSRLTTTEECERVQVQPNVWHCKERSTQTEYKHTQTQSHYVRTPVKKLRAL